MNGRVYDPHLGRFLSADPFIQLPHSTQGLNRYAYVLNNPLSLTDPSGYFIKWAKRKVTKLVRGAGRALRGALKSPIVQTAVSLYVCQGNPACMAGASATFTALNGGELGEVIFAAGVTYVSALAYGVIPEHFPNPGLGKTVAHGVVGGVVAELGGRRFRTGFISAGAAQLAAPGIGHISTPQGRVVAAAVVGGTAAKLGGGKFANGAATAAFARMYGEYREWQRGRTYANMDGLEAALAGGKAVIGARPLEKLGFGKYLGMIRNAIMDVNNVELMHEQLFWLEGDELRNAGFFPDGVREDPRFSSRNLSLYRFDRPFVPSQPVQPVIDALRSRYPAADYDLIHNNCQCFMDDVRRELQ